MVLNLKMMIIVAVVIAAAVLSVGSAFAQHDSDTTRPGWGFGDNNHVHTGPPGQSVRVSQSNSASVSNSVVVHSNTGGNRVRGNTNGTTTVSTGDSNVLVRLMNNLNRNIFRWFN